MDNFTNALEYSENLPPIYFSGRKKELGELKRLLFNENHQFVSVTGTVGIGKTALVRHFAAEHKERFSGGTHFLNSLMMNERGSDLLASIERTGEPILFVLDEFGTLPQSRGKEMLHQVTAKFPNSKIILVSQVPMQYEAPRVHISPLSFDQMTELWQSQLATFPQTEARRLYDLVSGNPMLGQLLGRLIRDKEFSVEKFLELSQDFSQPGIVDAIGNPVKPKSEQEIEIVSGLVVASKRVLEELAKHPDDLHRLTPREFEELVADLLARQGYDVALTPPSKDGGKDIYVAKKSGLGSALYVVECKKYASHRPVGVGLVRQLYGVVEAEKFTGGVVATTSFFTRGAKEFKRSVDYRMNLVDYVELHRWIKQVLLGAN